MAQHVMTDQTGVRFGIACGALFVLAAGVVAAPVAGWLGPGGAMAGLALACATAHACVACRRTQAVIPPEPEVRPAPVLVPRQREGAERPLAAR